MPRRRRDIGCSYLPLIILLILLLGLVTGVLRIEVSPQIRPPSNVTIDLPDLPSAVSTLAPGIVFSTPANPAAAPPAAALGQRTKTLGCVTQNSLPDPACTPGAVFPNAAREQICVAGYSSAVRDVSSSLRDQVYTAYGITQPAPGEYEVDHLVPLALGGSNDIANLWPEAKNPRPGADEKDKVEDYLQDQVCNGAMNLQEAQHQIATNWLAVYQSLPNK